MSRPCGARLRLASVLVSAQVLAGCASGLEPSCLPDQQAVVTDLLYFGTTKPDGAVSAAEWSEFLRGVVTPRFAEGFTVWQAFGQWKSADGALAREASYVLNVVHPENETSEAAIRTVISEYKARFRQKAVLRVKTRGCASL